MCRFVIGYVAVSIIYDDTEVRVSLKEIIAQWKLAMIMMMMMSMMIDGDNDRDAVVISLVITKYWHQFEMISQHVD